MSIKSTVLSGAGSPDTVYQSNGQTAVTTAYYCNRSPALITVNIHLVPSGQSATVDNIIYWAIQIAANDTYIMDTERLIFDQGDSIVAEASLPSAIVATVSYVGV